LTRIASMRLLPSASLTTLFILVGACSLINAPEDVVSEGAGASTSAGTTSDGGKDSTTGGTTSDGGTGDMPSGGDLTGGGGDMTGVGGDTMTDEDPGPGVNPTTGMLVLATQDAKKARHLVVINGRTGKGVVTEALPVAAVAYDEAPGRHAWFVFTASAYPATPTGAADLEVRRFNELTNKWFVVGRTTALPPPEPDQLVVLNDRLAYISHRVVGGKAVSALTVLDTSDLKNITEVDSMPAGAGETFVGLTGDRGSDVNEDAPGGRLRLMVSSACNTTGCDLHAQQIFVGDTLTAGTAVKLDHFVGQPRFVKARTEDKLFVALRSTTPSSRVVVRSFQGPDLTAPTLLATIAGFQGDDVGGFTLAECAQAGVISDVMGSQLVAFHLVSGTQHLVHLDDPGGPVYTEPFGPSVISLGSSMPPGLRAFELSKSGTMNIAINERSVWQPNNPFVPLTGATRRGEAFRCP
jgi:hypothetical protein